MRELQGPLPATRALTARDGVVSAVSMAVGGAFGVMGALDPKQVDPFLDLIARAGMPGAILFLLLWVVYWEFSKGPAKDAEIERLHGTNVQLWEARLRDKDIVVERLNGLREQEIQSKATFTQAVESLRETLDDALSGG